MAGFGVDRGSGSSSGGPETTLAASIIDAKGDLIAGTAADTAARLAVGANETRLVAASAETAGLKYVADTVNYAIAAKGDLLVGTAADTVAALTVGANEKRLVADSVEATGAKWVADTVNYAIAAKGDLLVGTAADTVAALTVGTSGYLLVADAAEATGVKWAAMAASDTAAGILEIATQAEQETGSDTTRAVSPGRQQFHASAAKAWVRSDTAGGIQASYGVSSVTDNGTGAWTVNFSTSFSSASYGVAAINQVQAAVTLAVDNATPPTAAACKLRSFNTTTNNAEDPNLWSASFHGDL